MSEPRDLVGDGLGRGSEDLVESLLGAVDQAVVDGHSRNWGRLRERCHAFHDVPELLRHCRDAGLKVVLCTSGEEDKLARADGAEVLWCGRIHALVEGKLDARGDGATPSLRRVGLGLV